MFPTISGGVAGKSRMYLNYIIIKKQVNAKQKGTTE